MIAGGGAMLRLEGVTKGYATAQGPLLVLDGVSLALPLGRTAALVGESGSGKSTLLHLVAGLDRVDAGRIWVGEREVTALRDADLAAMRREAVGLVFQQFNLIPSLDVAGNLAFQARIAGRLDPRWQKEIVERLGLGAMLSRFPEQLSGGQQQRVAIGRALAGRPALLLADEPTGNLDEATGNEVMALMLDLVTRSGAAMLMVTHSARLAGMLDERVMLRGGRLAA
jgi:putative ABC transport system ATP-binding protein